MKPVKSKGSIGCVLGTLVLGSCGLFSACGGKNSPSGPGVPAVSPTFTSTPVVSDTLTPLATKTATGTPTQTLSFTPTSTLLTSTSTPAVTDTFTPPATKTATGTPTQTFSSTPTSTLLTSTFTATSSPTNTRTSTLTVTVTSTATLTGTPTNTATNSPTVTLTLTPYYSAFVTIGGSGSMNGPIGIVSVGGGNLWVTNAGTNSLAEWTTAGVGPSTTITTFNSGDTFDKPRDIALDAATQNLYVSDSLNHRIVVFNSSGSYLTSFGAAQFGTHDTIGVAVNSAGTTVYTVDYSAQACYAWAITPGTTPAYTYLFTFGNSGTGALRTPLSTSIDSHGDVWVADQGNHRVAEYTYAGVYMKAVTLAGAYDTPADVIVDSLDNIFVTETSQNDLQEFNSAGTYLGNIGSGFSNIGGLTLDGAGNLYVVDLSLNQVIGFQYH